MNDALKIAGPFFVILLFASSLIYVSMLLNPESAGSSQEQYENIIEEVPKADECALDSTINCTNSGGCSGYKMCRDGKWGECIVRKICSPGDRTGCFVNGCTTGHSTCNACGTAYENCTPG